MRDVEQVFLRSLFDFDPRADFTFAMEFATMLSGKVLKESLPNGVCLNVNVPAVKNIKGLRLCRQADAKWTERFVQREDPAGNNYYWLTGFLENKEPNADDTDEAVLEQGYVSVVPCKVDLTDYHALSNLKKWNYETKV